MFCSASPPPGGEEGTGTRCGLYAVVDEGDAGMLKIYDGLRKGLELAQLPRVCREPGLDSEEARAAFLLRVRKAGQLPVFAIGESAVASLGGPKPGITRVFAFERYTAEGRPLLDLPVWDRLAIVYAALPAERVGAILRGLTRKKTVVVYRTPSKIPGSDAKERRLKAFAQAAGIRWSAGGGASGGASSRVSSAVSSAVSRKAPDVVLHLRLHGTAPRVSFAAALALARKLHVPLVSDDRSRFGHGAVVTLVGRHDLVGKAAAEVARRLRQDPRLKIPPYGLPGIDVWVDLGAADDQGCVMPLPFLARADRLERGAKRRPAPRKAAR